MHDVKTKDLHTQPPVATEIFILGMLPNLYYSSSIILF